jgi:hypothetical protein
MGAQSSDTSRLMPWDERKIDAATGAAARIGGRAGDEYLDPGERPLAEAGEGVAEGFELAEDDLIDASETGRAWSTRSHPRSKRATRRRITQRAATRLPPRSSTATDNRGFW